MLPVKWSSTLLLLSFITRFAKSTGLYLLPGDSADEIRNGFRQHQRLLDQTQPAKSSYASSSSNTGWAPPVGNRQRHSGQHTSGQRYGGYKSRSGYDPNHRGYAGSSVRRYEYPLFTTFDNRECYSCVSSMYNFPQLRDTFDQLFTPARIISDSCDDSNFGREHRRMTKHCTRSPCVHITQHNTILGTYMPTHYRGCLSDLLSANATITRSHTIMDRCRTFKYTEVFGMEHYKKGDLTLCVCRNAHCNHSVPVLLSSTGAYVLSTIVLLLIQ